uniref:Small ribosomal subunit protein uS4c n=2 Tax=Chlorella vulgaris TaxID=3077 RepID=RR4_CHLVU|nr:ribosomal protein S4 [Chlorella vulgaris]P32975.1 RecName: Full=Small ribosomal subunit protein uS4c; AltName: Full=30S ribosomal protein S4, chloroplastic [Chlorella vulgaris]QSV10905.1 ribosomal protein S4 [Chlorella vulgaris]BAA01767.1 ribosomal protein S4 [Chlorella vulgaris]BAA57980.1 30S ribosomal protein S4 [Chlorella vulgaris]
MARYRGPKLRIVRRLGELPGLTQKNCTRDFPPGQHGPKKKGGGNQKTKESQYAVRLKEKQKLRFNYGISERQLMSYVREARKRKGSTGEILLQILEMRLDTIIFRLGFAPTIAAARQLINHGHIVVNGRRVDIPSSLCKVNDSISVALNSQNFVKNLLQSFTKTLDAPYLEVNQEKLSAVVRDNIPREAVSLQINELLVVEFYSRKV